MCSSNFISQAPEYPIQQRRNARAVENGDVNLQSWCQVTNVRGQRPPASANRTMAREMTPVPATPASHTASHIGARDELVRLLNAHANNDLLAYHLLPLVRDLNQWGNCSAALEAIIGAARYTLTSVWGLAYDMYYNPSDYGSD